MESDKKGGEVMSVSWEGFPKKGDYTGGDLPLGGSISKPLIGYSSLEVSTEGK